MVRDGDGECRPGLGVLWIDVSWGRDLGSKEVEMYTAANELSSLHQLGVQGARSRQTKDG